MRLHFGNRILGDRHCKLPADRPIFPKANFVQILSSGKVRDTTVQVWTVGEGFGIGSEFSQTCCAANNFRDHEVLLRWFKGAGDYVSRPTPGETHGIFRTLAVSASALLHFYFDWFWLRHCAF